MIVSLCMCNFSAFSNYDVELMNRIIPTKVIENRAITRMTDRQIITKEILIEVLACVSLRFK